MAGRIRIFRGQRGSNGARALGRAMGKLVLRRNGSGWRGRPGRDTVINWGCTEAPQLRPGVRVINSFDSVAAATCKLATFRVLSEHDVPAPVYTECYATAREWLSAGHTVIVRKLLRASSGRGIVVVREAEDQPDLPAAPLYTQYFKGTHEYRIHVISGQVVDRSEKRRREGVEDVNNEVRNLAGGWVFCRENVAPIPIVDEAAVAAVAALGLDFGAVDVKCNRQHTKCAVLEVNTAPGLEGTTLERYAEGIRRLT